MIHTKYTHLADRELLRVAYSMADPMTSTPLESELAQRLERYVDHVEVIEVIDEFDYTGANLKALGQAVIGDVDNTAEMLEFLNGQDVTDTRQLKGLFDLLYVLRDNDIDDPADLNARLKQATRIDAIVDEAADLLTRITTLTKES